MAAWKGHPKGTRFVMQANGVMTTLPPPYTIELRAPALKTDQRGLILTPPTRVDKAGFSSQSGLDPDQLRLALLFWDRIDTPISGGIHLGVGREGYFLEQEGLLSQSIFQPTDGVWRGGELIQKSHLSIFEAFEERDPGRWSLARGERSLNIIEPESVPARGILFDLHQVIPIPRSSVPLEDVLRFRDSRRSEMLALRHHLERVYQSIRTAPDRALAEATELAELDRAIADHIKVAKEARFGLRLTDLQAKIDAKVVGAGVAVGMAATAAALPLASSLLIGAAAAGMASISATFGLRKARDTSTPFEYVSRMEREI